MNDINTNKQLLTDLLSVEDIFKNRFFEIPDYQRGYAWEKKQIEDFMKDVENLFDKSYKHFTGTIVITPKEEDDKNTFQIVDGQQRITTICLLMRCISETFPDQFDHLVAKFLFRGSVGEEKEVLRTNKETWTFFRKIIIEGKMGTPKISSERRIMQAKKILEKWIKEDIEKTKRILKAVCNNLGFIVFAPQKTNEIGIMFEVINNRGKPLSELEKIKNYFIFYASIYGKEGLREKVNLSWGTIQHNLSRANVISNDDENKFLRNCYLVFFDPSKSKSRRVYDKIKEEFSPHLKEEALIDEKTETILNFISFLEESAEYYAYLLNPSFFNESYQKDYKIPISKTLVRLRCQHTRASIMPLYLSIMSYLNTDSERVKELLEVLEKVNFRVYLLPKITSRADSHQAILFDWASWLYTERDWDAATETDKEETKIYDSDEPFEGDILDWIRLSLIAFGRDFCPERKFIQALTIDDGESEDYYRWSGLRFFLASYEEHLQGQSKTTFDIQQILRGRQDDAFKSNDYLSVEHIWARANLAQRFRKDDLQKRRLGNLVLIGLSKNIQLSDKAIPDKVAELLRYDKVKGHDHIPLRQVTDLEGILERASDKMTNEYDRTRKTKKYYGEISKAINDERETEMIRFATERWAFPDEKLTRFDKVDSFLENEVNRLENFHLKENT